MKTLVLVMSCLVSTGFAQGPAPIEPPQRTQETIPEKKHVSVPTGANDRRTSEYAGEDTQDVLRDLAQKAKMDIVVSNAVEGTITLRLENKTPREVLDTIVYVNSLTMDEVKGVYYINRIDAIRKEAAVRNAEPAKLLFKAYLDKGFTRPEAMKLMLNVPGGAHNEITPPPRSTSKTETKSGKRSPR